MVQPSRFIVKRIPYIDIGAPQTHSLVSSIGILKPSRGFAPSKNTHFSRRIGNTLLSRFFSSIFPRTGKNLLAYLLTYPVRVRAHRLDFPYLFMKFVPRFSRVEHARASEVSIRRILFSHTFTHTWRWRLTRRGVGSWQSRPTRPGTSPIRRRPSGTPSSRVASMRPRNGP